MTRCAGCLVALIASTLWTCRGAEKAARREPQVIDSPATTPARPYCSPDRRGPVQISQDSVGPLDLHMNLGILKIVCPAAYDSASYEAETANPALVFPFNELTVVAVQYQTSLRLNQPADVWAVSGANGLVSGRLPLAADWTELRGAFGPGVAFGADRLIVMFCAYPRLLFALDAPPESASVPAKDLTRIPAGARIREVEILLRSNPTWHC